MRILSVKYQDIVDAHLRIKSITHKTLIATSNTANQLCNAQLFFKCENFQRMGAFKFRGAYNALAQLDGSQKRAGVVTFSSGNHAQAVALSANLLKMKAVVIMPTDAPKIKIEATQDYGADIIFYDRYKEDREKISQRLSHEHGYSLIPPYDHPHVIAGQGTAVKELIEEIGPLDIIITPLGGGGLLAGSAIVAKSLHPNGKIYGVEPETANDGQRSLREGKIVHIDTPKTIADGAQTQYLGSHTFPIIQHYVDDIFTVNDQELIQAMHFMASRMKMIVEPTGCLAIAALLSKKIEAKNKRVGILLSGGNIDLTRFSQLISQV